MGDWFNKLIDDVETSYRSAVADSKTYELLPVIQKFQDAVEEIPDLTMLFTKMFQEVPAMNHYKEKTLVTDYRQMFRALNAVLTSAPVYDDTLHGEDADMYGCMVSPLLVWAMATPSGIAAFLNETVNYHLKEVLEYWGNFLKSSDSCYVLTDNPSLGWFSENALKKMPGFAVQYKCDPSQPHYGFQSWDHFFTREFRDGMRPIAAPDNDCVIVHACESSPFKIQRNVQFTDTFWIKSQNYSLRHILGNDPQTSEFVGGTVYQAYLNTFAYHRWHSPVSGKIVKAFVKPGAYYSQSLDMGLDKCGFAQGYMAHVATRAIVFIQADNPDIGLMVFVAVGICEVSSCEIGVEVGQRVKKGQQTGMFHFGGSSHCLIFRPNVKIEFNLHGQIPSVNTTNLPINTLLATVS